MHNRIASMTLTEHRVGLSTAIGRDSNGGVRILLKLAKSIWAVNSINAVKQKTNGGNGYTKAMGLLGGVGQTKMYSVKCLPPS